MCYNNYETVDTKHHAMVQDKNVKYFARKQRSEKRWTYVGVAFVVMLWALIAGLVWPVVEWLAYMLGILPVTLP